MAGLSVVTIYCGGMVEFSENLDPSKSTYTSYFDLSRHLSIYLIIESYLNVHLPCSKDVLQLFSV